MTEQTPAPGPEVPDEPHVPVDPDVEEAAGEPHEPSAASDPTRTGLPAVDAVLEEIDDLDDLPLDQHLGAFERAHQALRSALDAPSDDVTGHRADPAADEPA